MVNFVMRRSISQQGLRSSNQMPCGSNNLDKGVKFSAAWGDCQSFEKTPENQPNYIQIYAKFVFLSAQ